MNTKNLKPFDLQAALKGEPVMLRDGGKAFVRHHETAEVVADSLRLWGVITTAGGIAALACWTKEGRFIGDVAASLDIIGMWPKLTRIVNGFEVPAPEKESLKDGVLYYVPAPHCKDWTDWVYWVDGDDEDEHRLEHGLVFRSKEDATANAKAMLGIDPYEEVEE